MKKKILVLLLMSMTILGTSIPATASTTQAKPAIGTGKTILLNYNPTELGEWYMARYGTIGYGYNTRSEGVRVLQTLLNSFNFNCGEADGIFGPKTYNALRNFQSSMNLRRDGICGVLTWEQIGRCYQN